MSKSPSWASASIEETTRLRTGAGRPLEQFFVGHVSPAVPAADVVPDVFLFRWR
jgi:hypothetical protein